MEIKLQILSGYLKRRNIKIKKNSEVRPVLTRIRQTIFDILYNYIDFDKKIALDVCCGTGILGLEFLSRGGKHSYFLDINKDNIDELKKNVSNLELEDKCTFFVKNALTPSIGKEMDVVFLDPPYKSNFLIKKILRRLNENKWLGTETVVIIPMDKNYNHKLDSDYNIFRTTIIASTNILFLTKQIQNEDIPKENSTDIK
jgi:16S rRNA (guanine966-N2)-methyltransferase